MKRILDKFAFAVLIMLMGASPKTEFRPQEFKDFRIPIKTKFDDRFPSVGSMHHAWFDRPTCGVILVEEEVVVTAAHCITDNEGNLDIPHYIKFQTEDDKKFYVKGILVHPGYDPKMLNRKNYDIALIYLTDRVNVAIAPIRKRFSQEFGNIPVYYPLYACGWSAGYKTYSRGYLYGSLEGTDTLRWIGEFSHVIPGDSGGAVFIKYGTSDNLELVGIISGFTRMGPKKVLDSFATRIDLYEEWIISGIKDLKSRKIP